MIAKGNKLTLLSLTNAIKRDIVNNSKINSYKIYNNIYKTLKIKYSNVFVIKEFGKF